VNRYEAQAAAALAAVELRAPDAFLWFGRREAVRGEPLVRAVAQRLRDGFFSTGTPQPRPIDATRPAAGDGGALLAALSQANGGRGAWQAGWRLAGPGDDGDDRALPVVRPDGLTLYAPPEEVRADGRQATVLLPKELRGVSPGRYVALGDSGSPEGDERTALYWNIAAAGAPTLVARATYALNGAGVPFWLELPTDRARYGRGDAALLLVARADAGAAIQLLRPLLRALGPHLAAAAPAFTHPLSRGLAVAEQPPGRTAFGAHRCGLVAEAILAAATARDAGDQLAAVRVRFAAAGIGLDAPYLQPGSPDAYADA
jgi:hypothetical protein